MPILLISCMYKPTLATTENIKQKLSNKIFLAKYYETLTTWKETFQLYNVKTLYSFAKIVEKERLNKCIEPDIVIFCYILLRRCEQSVMCD